MTGLVTWRLVNVIDSRGPAGAVVSPTSAGRSRAVARSDQSAAVPVAVGGVEVACRVALATVADPAAAVGGELVVEQRRDGLVGRGPLGVAAAEDGVGDPVRRTVGGAADPRQNAAALSGGVPL